MKEQLFQFQATVVLQDVLEEHGLTTNVGTRENVKKLKPNAYHTCHLCDKKCLNRHSMSKHISTAHGTTCQLCGRTFEEDFAFQLSVHHRKRHLVKSDQPFGDLIGTNTYGTKYLGNSTHEVNDTDIHTSTARHTGNDVSTEDKSELEKVSHNDSKRGGDGEISMCTLALPEDWIVEDVDMIENITITSIEKISTTTCLHSSGALDLSSSESDKNAANCSPFESIKEVIGKISPKKLPKKQLTSDDLKNFKKDFYLSSKSAASTNPSPPELQLKQHAPPLKSISSDTHDQTKQQNNTGELSQLPESTFTVMDPIEPVNGVIEYPNPPECQGQLNNPEALEPPGASNKLPVVAQEIDESFRGLSSDTVTPSKIPDSVTRSLRNNYQINSTTTNASVTTLRDNHMERYDSNCFMNVNRHSDQTGSGCYQLESQAFGTSALSQASSVFNDTVIQGSTSMLSCSYCYKVFDSVQKLLQHQLIEHSSEKTTYGRISQNNRRSSKENLVLSGESSYNLPQENRTHYSQSSGKTTIQKPIITLPGYDPNLVHCNACNIYMLRKDASHHLLSYHYEYTRQRFHEIRRRTFQPAYWSGNHSNNSKQIGQGEGHMDHATKKSNYDLNGSIPAVVLTCPSCPFQTVVNSVLTSHIQQAHQLSISYCRFCDYSSLFQGHVETHIRNYHQQKHCQFCTFTTVSSLQLSDHVATVHMGVESQIL